MTLASDKESQAEPSPIPTSGSHPTDQSQNLSNNQTPLDKTGNEDHELLPTAEKGINPPNATKNLDECGIDPLGENGLGSGLTRSSTALKPTATNGIDQSTQLVCTSGQDQPRLGITSSPMHPKSPPDAEPAFDSSTSVAQQANSNGRAGPIDGPPSPAISPSTIEEPLTNGSLTSEMSDAAMSIAGTSSTLPLLPFPSTSSPKDTPIPSSFGTQKVKSHHNATDVTGHISTRTRSRQKRPSESLLNGPAKRARVASNTPVASGQYNSEPEASPKSRVSDKGDGDIAMRDPPTYPLEHPTASDTDVMDATPPNKVCPQPPSTANSESQATPPPLETNSTSHIDPALSLETNVDPPTSSNNPSDHTSASADTSSSSDLSALVPEAKSNLSQASSNLTHNPYLGLSTAFLKGSVGSGATGFNPYALYYGPGTPITPHTPTYPYPYIYHLPSPISAQAMYPTSPGFPSSPTIQKHSPAPSASSGEPQRQKPKRLKAHTVTSGNHNIPIVPRDKKGKPMLPLNVGIMTVIRLGEVCMREHFHTERYIFPVGYEVTRRYLSTMDPTTEVVYHCTILDGGDGPKFQIVPSDAPDRTIIAGTATGAWSSIVRQANAIRSRQHSNSVSGPDFFGLGQNTIKHLIQELPNADRLRDYVWQNFIEGGPLGGRHAAVTPALPEDYDSTLPIGALYPSERDRMKREANSSPRGLNHYPQHIIAQAEAQRKQHPVGQGPQQPLVLPTATGTEFPTLPGTIGHPPNQTPATVTGSPLVQPHPQNSLSETDGSLDPQSPSASVPTTIAGIMNAIPMPNHTPTPAPVQVGSPAPPATSSATS